MSAFATSAIFSFRKSFEDALENLSIEENQLHQQLELKSSNDTVQLTLTALAPSLRELPRSLASRGALALRRRLATLHRGIRQLCQQNATPQRPKRPPDNVAWIPHKRGGTLMKRVFFQADVEDKNEFYLDRNYQYQ